MVRVVLGAQGVKTLHGTIEGHHAHTQLHLRAIQHSPFTPVLIRPADMRTTCTANAQTQTLTQAQD